MIQATNLNKSFGSVQAVHDVSFCAKDGSITGILGPNGAGKTTCFYIITGLIAADYGEIYLDGQEVTNLPMYRRSRLGVGYLPQEPSIFRGLIQNVLGPCLCPGRCRVRRDAPRFSANQREGSPRLSAL